MRNAPAITAVKLCRTGDVIDDFEGQPDGGLLPLPPELAAPQPGERIVNYGPARAALDRLIASIPPDDAQKHRDLRAIKGALSNA